MYTQLDVHTYILCTGFVLVCLFYTVDVTNDSNAHDKKRFTFELSVPNTKFHSLRKTTSCMTTCAPSIV